MHTRFNAFLLPAVLVLPVWAGPYVLKEQFVGQGFLDAFTWQTIDDPTHGRVNYVDQATALQKNLTFASDTKFLMRADDQTVVSPAARGRDSIRILSNEAYSEGIYILDVSHMPEGCSTWPAFRTKDASSGSVIDIIEGVNIGASDLVSLHTTPGCLVPQNRLQTGTTVSTNCSSGQGCGTSLRNGTYGDQFNKAGGGYFAMRRDKVEGISVWFLPRDTFPLSDTPEPTFLQALPPDAYFPVGSDCDYDQHFKPQQIMIDLTFCGDWAGADWTTSSCASLGPTCNAFVDNNPSAFTSAYWEINSLKIYIPSEQS
ncbi:hypothetical protein BV22DRAFT_1133889 [Leucogyrophana mollusca]|uniref:Uncharacterized protein n=1 Tax=Leucogyrophana mollusca TaxID=85980 RepID=A0ACB8B2N6_9AGAM|nr:hypothetical protein BV22DRAFT_1133889 [Leucogyrophana mollusca]